MTVNSHPARRVRGPRDRSVTRRKELAQEIRNELQAYKGTVGTLGFPHAQEARLQRIDSKFAELLALEGFER